MPRSADNAFQRRKCSIADNADDIAAVGLKATKTGVTLTSRKPISGGLIVALTLASRKALGV